MSRSGASQVHPVRESVLAPALVLAMTLALALVLAGCGTGNRDQSLLGPADAAAASDAPRSATSSAYPTTATGLLDALGRAVLDHDRTRFAALLSGGATFHEQQLRFYDNLQRLPVQSLSFRADGGHVTRTLRLDTYDDGPLVGPAGIRVVLRSGHALAAADPSDAATDPWDLTTIRVRTSGGGDGDGYGGGGGVLVVGDVADADRLSGLLDATRAAVAADGAVVPLSWSHTAVVYAFRDPTVIASYARVPGGNPNHLGALTYPVRDASGERVGSRIAVLPPALDAGPDDLARILRHEVTHVAIGALADDVPTWLSEGLAEYVASRPVPAAEQRIATVALARARGHAVQIPSDFTAGDQTLHYAVSWQACEHLAATDGPGVLWDLLDAMSRARVGRDGRSGVGQDAVLRQVTGLDTDRLAERTGDRIRSRFR